MSTDDALPHFDVAATDGAVVRGLSGDLDTAARLCIPCNSGAPAVISRTRRALLLSCTQAIVAEFRRQTLAPDDMGEPR